MKHIFKRELAAFLAAAAVLGGILAGATHYLTPQQHDYGSIWGMYEQEQTDSIDVLFFGSSVTYCDVVPAVYWKNSGLTAFVQAGPEQPLPLTLDYLKESLRTQSPKAVFVECTGIAFHKYMGFTKTNIGQMPWGINRLHATFFNAEPEVRKGLLFPLYFYHDRWTTLKSEDVQPYTEDMLAGYTFLSGGTDKVRTTAKRLILPRRTGRATWMPSKIFTRSAAGTIFSWCCTVPRQSVCTTPTGTG